MDPYPHRLLSRYRITFPGSPREGVLAECADEEGRGAARSRLPRWGYDEKHLEEWVCRRPQTLFPDCRVHVLVAEKYAQPLPCKVDLLLVDAEHNFHVVEMKAVPVARNGTPETPSKIRRQMQEYVKTLTWYLPPFPRSLVAAYSQFSASFCGTPKDLVEDLHASFGNGYGGVTIEAPRIHQVYLAEEYDQYAVDYFRLLVEAGEGSVRLVYYRFYPIYPEGPYIEFWEVPLTATRSTPGEALSAP
jgi:hypothetical protein